MDGRDPHYLHERKALEAVVSPPVDGASALAWHPRREELIVATRGGLLWSVDPVMGTRHLAEDLPEAGALAIHPDGQQVAILGRGAALEVRALPSGELLHSLELSLLSNLWVGWWKGGLAVAGQGMERQEVIVLDPRLRRRASGELPPGAVVGVDEQNELIVGRVSSQGPEILPLGKGKLQRLEPTGHRLRFGPGGRLVGVAEGGVTVWTVGEPALTVRSFGVSAAALSPTGSHLALGTREGGVALARMEGGSVDRAHPGKSGGHEQAVRSLQFSHRGRWLASVAERIWLWSW